MTLQNTRKSCCVLSMKI